MKIIKHEIIGDRRLILTSEDGINVTEYISGNDTIETWFRVPDFSMMTASMCGRISKALSEFFAHEDYYARKKNDA